MPVRRSAVIGTIAAVLAASLSACGAADDTEREATSTGLAIGSVNTSITASSAEGELVPTEDSAVTSA